MDLFVDGGMPEDGVFSISARLSPCIVSVGTYKRNADANFVLSLGRIFVPYAYGQRVDIIGCITDDSEVLVASFQQRPAATCHSAQTLGRTEEKSSFAPTSFPCGCPVVLCMFPMADNGVKKRVPHLAEQTTRWRQAGISARVVHDCSARLISTIQLPQPLEIMVPHYAESESSPRSMACSGSVLLKSILRTLRGTHYQNL